MTNIEIAKQYILKNVSPDYTFIRTLTDGAYVAFHGTFTKDAQKFVSFDILIFEGPTIVKHIANSDVLVATKTPSGHTQLDGTLIPNRSANRDTTLQVVGNTISGVLVDGPNMEHVTDFFGATYVQHHVGVPDGVEALIKGVTMLKSMDQESIYSKIEHNIIDGDMALLVSRGQAGGVAKMYYDLFRVNGTHIVEHWDIVQPVVEGQNI